MLDQEKTTIHMGVFFPGNDTPRFKVTQKQIIVRQNRSVSLQSFRRHGQEYKKIALRTLVIVY